MDGQWSRLLQVQTRCRPKDPLPTTQKHFDWADPKTIIVSVYTDGHHILFCQVEPRIC